MAASDTSAVSRDDQPYRDRRMTLGAHLLELRKRVMIGAAGLLVGMIVAFIIAAPVIEWLQYPIDVVNSARGQELTAALNFTGVTSGFDFRLRLAFAMGLVMSAPVWLWQAWAFVTPGLTRKELRYTIWFMVSAIPLFFGGAFVGWLITPHMVELMAQFVPSGGTLFYDATQYFDLVIKLILAVAIAFVSPVFLIALNLAGLLRGIAIIKGWRIVVIVAMTFAAIATPSADITSMLVLGGVLIVLYMLAGLLAMLFDRRRKKKNPDTYVDL